MPVHQDFFMNKKATKTNYDTMLITQEILHKNKNKNNKKLIKIKLLIKRTNC